MKETTCKFDIVIHCGGKGSGRKKGSANKKKNKPK